MWDLYRFFIAGNQPQCRICIGFSLLGTNRNVGFVSVFVAGNRPQCGICISFSLPGM